MRRGGGQHAPVSTSAGTFLATHPLFIPSPIVSLSYCSLLCFHKFCAVSINTRRGSPYLLALPLVLSLVFLILPPSSAPGLLLLALARVSEGAAALLQSVMP